MAISWQVHAIVFLRPSNIQPSQARQHPAGSAGIPAGCAGICPP